MQSSAVIVIALVAVLGQSQALRLPLVRFQEQEITLNTQELMNSNLTYLNNGTAMLKIYTPCQNVRPGTDQGNKMCAVIKHYNWLDTSDEVLRTFAPKQLDETFETEAWLRQCLLMFENAVIDTDGDRPMRTEIECIDRPKCTPIENEEELRKVESKMGNDEIREKRQVPADVEQKTQILEQAGFVPTHKCTVVTQIQDGFVNLVGTERGNFRLEMVEVPVFEPRQRMLQNPENYSF